MLRTVLLLPALVSLVTLAGCHGVVVAGRAPVVVAEPGPPPHAPAHGYRRKHHAGVELRFDARLGVYVVLGHDGIYFHDDWFVRSHDGVWQVSASLEGPWELRDEAWVPPGLREAKHAKKPKKRGRGAAKGAW